MVGLQADIAHRPGGESHSPAMTMLAGLAESFRQHISMTPATIVISGPAGIHSSRVRSMLRDDKHRVLPVASTPELLDVLHSQRVDLVIFDAGPSMKGALDLCRRIKFDSRTELIPVMILAEQETISERVSAINSGADEVLSAPYHPDVFRSRVRALLRQKSATDRLEQSETVLFTLAQAVEQRDGVTSRHCERLAFISLELGMAAGLSHKDLLTLYGGCFLHDIGKVAIPDRILFKKGPLTPEEWAIMRTHTIRGEQICRQLKSLEGVLPIIRSHHERWDGSGYPDGLRGEQIPFLARILQLADIYDALVSPRPYKTALSPETALQIMRQETEQGWRDPRLMSLFEDIHASICGRLGEFARTIGSESSLWNLQRYLSGDSALEPSLSN